MLPEKSLRSTCCMTFRANCAALCRAAELRYAPAKSAKALLTWIRQLWRQDGIWADQIRGARGVINVQCIRTAEGRVSFIEINPRFGGGTPLSLHAGADFPRWLLQMARGDDPGDMRDSFQAGMYMLRFDDAVFLQDLPPIRKA